MFHRYPRIPRGFIDFLPGTSRQRFRLRWAATTYPIIDTGPEIPQSQISDNRIPIVSQNFLQFR